MNRTATTGNAPGLRIAYLGSMFLLGLTGFAQMPIFKRYYIADAPGLGWLADFYVTHLMHYLAAAVLLAAAAYGVVGHLAARGRRSLTGSGRLRAAMLAGLIASGLLLVIRNLPGTVFPPAFIIFLDLFHLGLVMAFAATAVYCRLRGMPWLR